MFIEDSSSRLRKFIKSFGWLKPYFVGVGLILSTFLFVVIATASGVAVYHTFADDSTVSSGSSDRASSSALDDPSCNAVGVEIRGCIRTYRPETSDSSTSPSDSTCDTITSSEEVIWKLEEAANDPKIKAVVLQIDSGGGSPVAAEEIAATMKTLGKPSVAWVRESADSAAYWIGSSADTIIASAGSDIGSIGVTYSYVDNANKNTKDGLTYNQLTTGKYKDTGTTDRALTTDERALIMRDLNITLQDFVQAIATNRHLSVEKVSALADGSSMLGKMALENGLIDQLGTKQDVWKKLETYTKEKPNVCWP